MTHYEERLERDLSTLGEEVNGVGAKVRQAVQDAIHALLTGNRKLASETILRDGPINRAVRATDRLCYGFIARHLPSGGHLRLVSAIIRINIELERVGDYAVNISHEVLRLGHPPEQKMARTIEAMSKLVLQMFGLAMASFQERNVDKAKTTMVMAQESERLLSDALAQLEANEQGLGNRELFALFVVFGMLGRVADQAKNLCEEVVFAVAGQTKAPKVYNVLFVDREGAGAALLAAAVASKIFPESGRYSAASLQRSSTLNAALRSFADEYGFSLSENPLDCRQLLPGELADFHVIVTLGEAVTGFFADVPFHSVTLEWPLEALPAGDGVPSQRAVENIYRGLSNEIRDLMQLLRGKEAR